MACWMWQGMSRNGLEAFGASILTQRVSQRRHGAKTSKRWEPDTACSGVAHSTVSAGTCDVVPRPPHPCQQTASEADGVLRLSSRREVVIMAVVLHEEAPCPTRG